MQTRSGATISIRSLVAARIIGTEPVLSAQILRLSNSAAFNSSSKLNADLKTPTMRLGYAKVKNLTIAVGMKQLTEHKDLNKEIAQLMEGLWSRSVRVASFSYVLAKNLTRVNPDNALLAGLLHDVGKFYILNRANQYQALFTSKRALWSLVDAWHSNIGAAILENWSVSEDIQNAVQKFKNPEYIHRGSVDLTDAIFAADLLDAHFDESSPQKINWEDRPSVLSKLNLDEEKSEFLSLQMKVELDNFLSSIS